MHTQSTLSLSQPYATVLDVVFFVVVFGAVPQMGSRIHRVVSLRHHFCADRDDLSDFTAPECGKCQRTSQQRWLCQMPPPPSPSMQQAEVLEAEAIPSFLTPLST